MKNKVSLIVVFLSCFTFYAQNAISGYLNFENPKDWEQKIYLSKINNGDTVCISGTNIAENGYFSFNKSIFNAQNEIYKVYVNKLSLEEKKKLEDTIKNFETFILSREDSMHFQKGDKMLSNYITSNKANKEWQKYRDFKERLDTAISAKQYLSQTKGYIKDSLQILIVKLISIQTLDEKNLLEKDIRENPEYYLDLLNELKNSELNPLSYLYFENKIRMVNQQIIQKKYRLSRLLNITGVLVLIGLMVVIFKVRKKAAKVLPVALSKQENTIKNLISEGKTNKEIANELFISPSTVKTHITNIYSKLNISGRKELLLKN